MGHGIAMMAGVGTSDSHQRTVSFTPDPASASLGLPTPPSLPQRASSLGVAVAWSQTAARALAKPTASGASFRRSSVDVTRLAGGPTHSNSFDAAIRSPREPPPGVGAANNSVASFDRGLLQQRRISTGMIGMAAAGGGGGNGSGVDHPPLVAPRGPLPKTRSDMAARDGTSGQTTVRDESVANDDLLGAATVVSQGSFGSAHDIIGGHATASSSFMRRASMSRTVTGLPLPLTAALPPHDADIENEFLYNEEDLCSTRYVHWRSRYQFMQDKLMAQLPRRGSQAASSSRRSTPSRSPPSTHRSEGCLTPTVGHRHPGSSGGGGDSSSVGALPSDRSPTESKTSLLVQKSTRHGSSPPVDAAVTSRTVSGAAARPVFVLDETADDIAAVDNDHFRPQATDVFRLATAEASSTAMRNSALGPPPAAGLESADDMPHQDRSGVSEGGAVGREGSMGLPLSASSSEPLAQCETQPPSLQTSMHPTDLLAAVPIAANTTSSNSADPLNSTFGNLADTVTSQTDVIASLNGTNDRGAREEAGPSPVPARPGSTSVPSTHVSVTSLRDVTIDGTFAQPRTEGSVAMAPSDPLAEGATVGGLRSGNATPRDQTIAPPHGPPDAVSRLAASLQSVVKIRYVDVSPIVRERAGPIDAEHAKLQSLVRKARSERDAQGISGCEVRLAEMRRNFLHALAAACSAKLSEMPSPATAAMSVDVSPANGGASGGGEIAASKPLIATALPRLPSIRRIGSRRSDAAAKSPPPEGSAGGSGDPPSPGPSLLDPIFCTAPPTIAIVIGDEPKRQVIRVLELLLDDGDTIGVNRALFRMLTVGFAFMPHQLLTPLLPERCLLATDSDNHGTPSQKKGVPVPGGGGGSGAASSDKMTSAAQLLSRLSLIGEGGASMASTSAVSPVVTGGSVVVAAHHHAQYAVTVNAHHLTIPPRAFLAATPQLKAFHASASQWLMPLAFLLEAVKDPRRQWLSRCAREGRPYYLQSLLGTLEPLRTLKLLEALATADAAAWNPTAFGAVLSSQTDLLHPAAAALRTSPSPITEGGNGGRKRDGGSPADRGGRVSPLPAVPLSTMAAVSGPVFPDGKAFTEFLVDVARHPELRTALLSAVLSHAEALQIAQTFTCENASPPPRAQDDANATRPAHPVPQKKAAAPELMPRASALELLWRGSFEALCDIRQRNFKEVTLGRIGLIHFTVAECSPLGANRALLGCHVRPDMTFRDSHSLLTRAIVNDDGELASMLVLRRLVANEAVNRPHPKDNVPPLIRAVLHKNVPALLAMMRHPDVNLNVLHQGTGVVQIAQREGLDRELVRMLTRELLARSGAVTADTSSVHSSPATVVAAVAAPANVLAPTDKDVFMRIGRRQSGETPPAAALPSLIAPVGANALFRKTGAFESPAEAPLSTAHDEGATTLPPSGRRSSTVTTVMPVPPQLSSAKPPSENAPPPRPGRHLSHAAAADDDGTSSDEEFSLDDAHTPAEAFAAEVVLLRQALKALHERRDDERRDGTLYSADNTAATTSSSGAPLSGRKQQPAVASARPLNTRSLHRLHTLADLEALVASKTVECLRTLEGAVADRARKAAAATGASALPRRASDVARANVALEAALLFPPTPALSKQLCGLIEDLIADVPDATLSFDADDNDPPGHPTSAAAAAIQRSTALPPPPQGESAAFHDHVASHAAAAGRASVSDLRSHHHDPSLSLFRSILRHCRSTSFQPSQEALARHWALSCVLKCAPEHLQAVLSIEALPEHALHTVKRCLRHAMRQRHCTARSQHHVTAGVRLPVGIRLLQVLLSHGRFWRGHAHDLASLMQEIAEDLCDHSDEMMAAASSTIDSSQVFAAGGGGGVGGMGNGGRRGSSTSDAVLAQGDASGSLHHRRVQREMRYAALFEARMALLDQMISLPDLRISVDEYRADGDGHTIVTRACEQDHVKLLAHLLSKQYIEDINAPCRDGRSPLIVAVMHQRDKVVALLLQQRRQIHVDYRIPCTAGAPVVSETDAAAAVPNSGRRGSTRALRYPNECTAEIVGKTALEIAHHFKLPKMVQLLSALGGSSVPVIARRLSTHLVGSGGDEDEGRPPALGLHVESTGGGSGSLHSVTSSMSQIFEHQMRQQQVRRESSTGSTLMMPQPPTGGVPLTSSSAAPPLLRRTSLGVPMGHQAVTTHLASLDRRHPVSHQ